MQKLREIVKSNFELIGYLILTLLLFCACFFRPFAWIAAVFAIVLAAFLRKETKLIGLLLFMHCFYALFHYQRIWGIALDIVVAGILMLMICAQYLLRVIKKEQKPNLKTLIPIGLFLVYTLMPFHECYWQDFFAMLFFYVFIYVIFEDRKQIDFRYIVRIFVVGLIISCLFALFKNVSPLLTEKMRTIYFHGKFRFQGFAYHPNTLTKLLMLATCAMLILKYKNKISLLEFLVAFVPMFIFGYLTISRSFIVTVATGIIVFTLFDFSQRKAKSLAFLSILLVIVFAVGGIFFSATKVYFDRITDDEVDSPEVQNVDQSYLTQHASTANLDAIFDSQSEEWKQGVFEGTIYFDPGRSGLRELYIRDWASSPKTIWLGRGISQPLIGQMSAHNLFVQELWKHGLVGYVFYAAIILGSINWKKLKQIKRYLPVLMILLPYFAITMIERCNFDYVSVMLIISAISFMEQLGDEDSNQHQQSIEPNPVSET